MARPGRTHHPCAGGRARRSSAATASPNQGAVKQPGLSVQAPAPPQGRGHAERHRPEPSGTTRPRRRLTSLVAVVANSGQPTHRFAGARKPIASGALQTGGVSSRGPFPATCWPMTPGHAVRADRFGCAASQLRAVRETGATAHAAKWVIQSRHRPGAQGRHGCRLMRRLRTLPLRARLRTRHRREHSRREHPRSDRQATPPASRGHPIQGHNRGHRPSGAAGSGRRSRGPRSGASARI